MLIVCMVKSLFWIQGRCFLLGFSLENRTKCISSVILQSCLTGYQGCVQRCSQYGIITGLDGNISMVACPSFFILQQSWFLANPVLHPSIAWLKNSLNQSIGSQLFALQTMALGLVAFPAFNRLIASSTSVVLTGGITPNSYNSCLNFGAPNSSVESSLQISTVFHLPITVTQQNNSISCVFWRRNLTQGLTQISPSFQSL